MTHLDLRDGLSLHSADCLELESFCSEAISSERLGLILFLQGGADVAFDNTRLRLGAAREHHASCCPAGTLISQSRPTVFNRYTQAGVRVRKVVISLAPEWFDAGGLAAYDEYREIEKFRISHLGLRQWRPSARLMGMAEQVLQPPRHTPMFHRLYLESRALDMVSEALGLLAHPGDGPTSLGALEMCRMQRLRALLDSGQADGYTLNDIVREAGVNATTLQRQFRALTGKTVFDYMRGRRLAAARLALERGDVSVTQVAWEAGYTSAANFTTAFKREFGITPRQVRR